MSERQPTPSHFWGDARFPTTHWSVILAAGSPESPRYREALETLCREYWFPLYAFLRRRGYGPDEAQDYTQGFFAHMLEEQDLCRADPNRGRFRSFLLSMLKHFAADKQDEARAQKRGGGKNVVSLDFADAEARYAAEPAHQLSPEKLFERSWALMVLSRTMARLRQDTAAADKPMLFEHLKAHLGGQTDAVPYRALAARLNMSEGAIKVAVHRLRTRYRELLREEVAQTVSTPEEVEDEIRALFTALAP
jgi:RNA polymerase sigma factor (sigma-70 family)